MTKTFEENFYVCVTREKNIPNKRNKVSMWICNHTSSHSAIDVFTIQALINEMGIIFLTVFLVCHEKVNSLDMFAIKPFRASDR